MTDLTTTRSSTPASSPEAPARRARRAAGVAGPVAILVLWQLSTTTGWLSSDTLPPPSDVAAALWDFVFGSSGRSLPGVIPFDGSAGTHVGASVYRLASAYLLAVLVALPVGLLLGTSQWARATLDPVIQALRPIPIFAWLPLAITWFGLGGGAARYLVFIGAVFPIIVNTADGTSRVPRGWVTAARTLGARGPALFRHLYLPAALPSIVTGLRLGMSLGWMSVIVGELTGTRRGIGVMMTTARETGRLDRVIVGMICFAVLGSLSDLVIRSVARPFTGWATQ